ncbi:Forms aploid and binucleate cells 1c, putative isoform 4 [Hibiscus syriacus]|uniref:Forms aploid and binucleate cells 1c, putative isoform 4 n=1 Tax=Hibiscus syriacus TaxID=106335 RepID=A0A6A3BP27_HIBSY|nr:Forms aploid and binucleate cells 1c, putative isoform 4 [Hibiscus syriacus]
MKGNEFSRMMSTKFCNFCCDGVSEKRESEGRKYCEKVHPSESLREIPEPPSPCSLNSEACDCGFSMQSVTSQSMTSFSTHPSSVSIRRSPCRSDEEDADDSGKHFLSLQKRQGGSPMAQDVGPFYQEKIAALRKPESGNEEQENIVVYSDDPIHHNQYVKHKPLDFENNGLIWFPPPEDENDEAESSFFAYDDEDDEIGDSGAMFSSSSSLSSVFPAREKQNEGNKEPLKAAIHGHFRALVSQLLLGEGIKDDTSRGGSMDPGDYVKVKCIASGSPSESTLVKGVKVPNQLASFSTLLQQENDHLKMMIAKIEALCPNVLLVEKSVSSYAQEYLLAKEISLVLNVKRPLLELIARCSGGIVCPSIDNLSTTQLGHCELFRVEKVSEEHETSNQFNKKPSKTLMFFEGCPRRLGCTVLLFLRRRKHSIAGPEKMQIGNSQSSLNTIVNASDLNDASLSLNTEQGELESWLDQGDQSHFFPSSGGSVDACNDDLTPIGPLTHTSILVSISSRCVLKGTVCERSRLLRIKFYGSFDKPLGRYLQDDLYLAAGHVMSQPKPMSCYTQQGNLTINVRRLSSLKLPGERDGKIWMWHRCLRCAHIDGVPPATHRVVMSDAAWGLSFGKFLELSFSNHATANRVATCGHSLQRDCLRFYGFGNMVAFFRYSTIDILSVHLPPSMLEFVGDVHQEWIRREAAELIVKMEMLYAEISDVLDKIELKSKSSDANELSNHIGTERSDSKGEK